MKNKKSRSKPMRERPSYFDENRPTNFGAAIRRLVKFAKKLLPIMFLTAGLEMVGVVLRLLGPNKLSDIADLMTAGLGGVLDMDGILSLCWTLVLLYGLGALISLFTGVIMTCLTQHVTKTLRSSISQKINRLPMAYFQGTTTGDVLSRVTNDAENIGWALQDSVVSLLSALTMFIGCMVMMFRTDWVMTVTAIFSSLLGMGLMGLIVGRSQKYFAARQHLLGQMNGHVEEIYGGHDLVRVFNGEGREKAKFSRINEDMYTAGWKSQFYSGVMQPLMGFVGNLGYVAVCVVGAAGAERQNQLWRHRCLYGLCAAVYVSPDPDRHGRHQHAVCSGSGGACLWLLGCRGDG